MMEIATESFAHEIPLGAGMEWDELLFVCGIYILIFIGIAFAAAGICWFIFGRRKKCCSMNGFIPSCF